MKTNDEGIEWETIDIIKEDNAKKRERIDNQLTQLYKGIGGIYDKNGNMSQYMKQTMNYLITYNLDKGTGSLLQTVQAPIPVTLSMDLDGIGGLQVGNVFRVDYLPETYREFCYFVITKVDHEITTSGWSTSIGAMMMADMPHYWEVHQNQLNEYQQDYIDLFKLTTVKLTDFGEGNFPEFDTLLEKFKTNLEQFEQLVNLYNNPKEEEVDSSDTFWLGADNKFFGLDLSFFGIGAGKYNKEKNRADRQNKVKKLGNNPDNINIRTRALQAIDQEYRELFRAQQNLEQKFGEIELFEKQIQETIDIMNNKINPEYKLIQEDVKKEEAEAEKRKKEFEKELSNIETGGYGGRGV